MKIIAIVTDSISSNLKILEVHERECSMRAMKLSMTKHLKKQGFNEEKVYRGPNWYYSGDNPIWLLRRKFHRRFHHCTPLGKRINRYVFLIDAEKYAAYSDEIERFKKQAEINRNKENGQ